MGIAAPLAWYAMLCALARRGSNRSYVAVLVAALPAIIVDRLVDAARTEQRVARVVHDVAWMLSRLDPWTYVEFHIDGINTSRAHQRSDGGSASKYCSSSSIARSPSGSGSAWRPDHGNHGNEL